ncbi:MAG: lytic transglycosylase domain-containing protein [Ruminococcaceae bacterium]|nr:lytic transglycosylase domain-containing protein [Oscillospiraceae bacterium]
MVLAVIGIKEFAEEKIIKFKQAVYPLRYMDSVEKYAEEFNIDKYLLLSYIKTESGFDPNAVSNAGAIGLTQITEETFAWIKLKLCPKEELVFEDLYQPDTAIRFGAYYISRNMDRYNGDVSTAAAAYHSGWGTVDGLLKEYQTEILTQFPYTQMENYVYKINKAYNAYQELYKISEGDF